MYLKFNVPNEIPAVFHNGSNYDCHFIVKEKECEGQLEFLGKNTEKCKTFSILMEKDVANIDKDGNESIATYKTKSTDSVKFMAISLSNLINNLAEGIYKVKCKDCDLFS